MSRTEPLPSVSPESDPTAVASKHPEAALSEEKVYLRELAGKPWPARIAGYLKLSGPGWLQSALTLGGGSLATGMYLGVIGGYGLMWLQPLAMILGIIMLSAIGYVTLSTGQRPFRVINQHVNPALGWGWLIASMLANMVWALPQYALATGVLKKNLFPGLLGSGGPFDDVTSSSIIAIGILAVAIPVTWSYGSGHWGVRLYERLLKVLVAVIVACFVGVVVQLSLTDNGLDWGAILAGFVPDFRTAFRPADGFRPLLDSLSAIDADAGAFWTDYIVAQQRDVLMGAFATAVGINMTFLLPYSMLGRGWGSEHRGLAIFDLSTGMFIPFLLATSCVVIASASQFHVVGDTAQIAPPADPAAPLSPAEKLLAKRMVNADMAGWSAARMAEEVRPQLADVSLEERQLAATLVTRDVDQLSGALAPLLGRTFADIVFGIGVLGMALSTITILMLVSGFVVCEVLDVPPTGWPMRLGSLAACTGVLGAFIWGDAKAWLAVPTSVFGLVLLPIAYLTFLLLVNSDKVLGDQKPKGMKLILANVLMVTATVVAFLASGWAVLANLGTTGAVVIGVGFLFVLLIGAGVRKRALT